MSSTQQPAPVADGRRRAGAARRRQREAELIAATRSLLDATGVRDAKIEDIARAVGVNRAIVYRHFSGQEELFALTLVTYLDELQDALQQATDSTASRGPREQLAALVEAFVDYGVAHPAFVDCAHALMRRTGDDLINEISESAMFRLGRAIAGCLSLLSAALGAGASSGDFAATEDPALTANMLYASALGALQLARVGLAVTEVAPGVPSVGTVSPDQVKTHLVRAALVFAGAR